ncbi:MAG: 50S ribosomal protein L20 [Bdellovibrionota bacterium]|nr:MAG: 50S ribosomal protein L20 [Bdellovibrionota bacterium]
MRVKRGFTSRRRHKRLMKLAEGFRGRRKNCFKLAKPAVQRALKYAYRDRRARKREMRQLWIARINAAVRAEGISYSRFMSKLSGSGVILDRKALAALAVENPRDFSSLVQQVMA